MNQLLQEANPLMSYASELESAITKVALVCDQDDDSRNIFPEKKDVMETMANCVEKMRHVASLLNGNESSSTVAFSKLDASVLSSLKDNYEYYCKQNNQLSAVLGELVKKLDLDGTGIDVYLLHYVADAMEALRSLLYLIKDIEYCD